jgi:pantoate--beta-alanine ligase
MVTYPIEAARRKTDVVVCSIFVNPTQFNDKDLENYPRPIEEDLRKLREFNCDVLFLPEVDEMYNNSNLENRKALDKILKERSDGSLSGSNSDRKEAF